MTSTPVEQARPVLDARLSGAELRRWYWLRSELAGLARALGVSTAGGKAELTVRLAAVLDGELPEAPARTRRTAPDQLTVAVDDATVIPPGQRCSQALRDYFVGRVGPGFRFDAPMRAFIAGGAGRTLGEAVEHWRASRSGEPRPIAPQFELNQFTRSWSATHRGGPRSELLAAWQRHRALPAEVRASAQAAMDRAGLGGPLECDRE